ncbi:hypothetical protein FQV18_0015694, partial [Eudyptula minor novaehollandiae]
VYVQREEETQKKKKNNKKQARILVAAVKEGQRSLSPRWNTEPKKMGPHKFRNKSQEGERDVLTCFYCGQKGHLKRSCRRKRMDEKKK